jgi:hypothetical protein
MDMMIKYLVSQCASKGFDDCFLKAIGQLVLPSISRFMSIMAAIMSTISEIETAISKLDGNDFVWFWIGHHSE